MPGQVSRPDDVVAKATRQLRQAGGLQEESLPRLHRELGAAAVPQGQAVGALWAQTHQQPSDDVEGEQRGPLVSIRRTWFDWVRLVH